MESKELGTAEHVVNVGAGAGSYQPVDRSVVAVEPAISMIRHRDLLGRSELDLGYRLVIARD